MHPARRQTVATTPVWTNGSQLVVRCTCARNSPRTRRSPDRPCCASRARRRGSPRAGRHGAARRPAAAPQPECGARRARCDRDARPAAPRGVRRALHARRRADGRGAAPDGELGEHQERLDYSCALFDADANLVANAPHMPCTWARWRQRERRARGLRGRPATRRRVPAELAVPRRHAPARHDRGHAGVRRRGRSAALLHRLARAHADVGGISPGSMPPGSRRIEEEGALIAPVRIVRAGRFDEPAVRQLLAGQRWPARNPAQNVADLRAQLAANARASARSSAPRPCTAGPRCSPTWPRAGQRRGLHAPGDPPADRRLVPLRDGQRAAGGGRHPRGPRRRHGHRRFHRHLRAAANNFNAPRAVTVAAVLYVFRTLVDEPIPLNAGCCARSRSSCRRARCSTPCRPAPSWPATSRPRSAWWTRSTARSGCRPPRRAR